MDTSNKPIVETNPCNVSVLMERVNNASQQNTLASTDKTPDECQHKLLQRSGSLLFLAQ